MKILALIGSPRRGGNTDVLVDEILKGSVKNGHASEKVYLYDYDIRPCVDCRACKKKSLVCPIKDDMKKLYPKMEAADLLIFGTPNYWFGPSAKMKLLIDRTRPYAANGKLKGKKWVLVTPAADGPRVCKALVQMLRLSGAYLGMKFVDQILVKAWEKGEIRTNQMQMKKAYRLGASL